MSKIIRLTAENVKRLQAIEITPEGDVVTIGGRNQQGKTSVLDSIRYALAGRRAISGQPVRRGQKKASSTVRLDNGLTVRRTVTKDGGGQLVITDERGARFPSPQKMLDDLCGTLTFDPMAFLRQPPPQQSETLRELVGLDFSADDVRRKALYDNRTQTNRELKAMEARLGGMDPYDDVPDAELSIADLVGELNAAESHNCENQRVREVLQEAVRQNEQLCGKAEEARQEISRWQQILAETERDLEAQCEWLEPQRKEVAALKETDVGAIKERIQQAEETNRAVRLKAQREQLVARIKETQAVSDEFTREIEALAAKKTQSLASAQYPIEGLSFDEEQVLYNDLPLENASRSEQIAISVAIAAACNPDLRIMLIEDGTLLDDASFQTLAQFAQQHDLQVWMEVVRDDEQCSVVIVDGLVRDGKKESAENAD